MTNRKQDAYSLAKAAEAFFIDIGLEKTALMQKAFKANLVRESFKKGIGDGFGKAIGGGAGIMAAFMGKDLLNAPINRAKMKKAWEIVERMAQSDHILKNADKKDLRAAFETLFKYAPDLATDKNSLKSILRASTISEGGIDYQTIKGLVEAQEKINKAKGKDWQGGISGIF